MPRMQEEILLRIFIAEDDYSGANALYRVIAERAMSEGLSGATVLPGPTGLAEPGRSGLNLIPMPVFAFQWLSRL